MNLAYRLYNPKDTTRLSELWERASGWGELSQEMVSRYIENAPFGEPIIALAEDLGTGELVGQMAFTASCVVVRGKPVRAFRPMAAILDPDLRVQSLNPLHHPIFVLYRFGLEEMRRRGEKLAFVIPDPRWRRALKFLPGLQHATYPLWSLCMPLTKPLPPRDGYASGELTSCDRELDSLFAEAADQYACIILRNAEAFRKKCGPPEYKVLGVHRHGKLVGVVASRQKGDKQWLICDLMAADDEATSETLKAACNAAHAASARPGGASVAKAAILATPPLLPLVKELGFERDAYDFHLYVKLLEGDLSAADVHPSHWYVSAND